MLQSECFAVRPPLFDDSSCSISNDYDNTKTNKYTKKQKRSALLTNTRCYSYVNGPINVKRYELTISTDSFFVRIDFSFYFEATKFANTFDTSAD